MTATTCSRAVESTVAPVDEGCTTNHSTIAEAAVLPSRELSLMNWERIVLFGVAGGTLVTWLAGASTPVPGGPSLAPPTPVPVVTLTFPEVERLRDRLRAPVAPAAPTRNLFSFQTARSNHRPLAPRDATVAAAPIVAVAPVRQAPPYTLIGLAEDTGANGPVRTAILTGPGGIAFVAVGDRVGSYRVDAISVDALQLSAAEDTIPFVLTLK